MDFKYFVLFFVLATSISAQASFETSPSILSVQPENGSADFVLGDKITILFDQAVKCSDRCVVFFVADNRVTELMVEDSMINGKELTLTPQLQEAKTYVVSIPKGALVGLNDLPFHGLYDYSIHTADVSNPTVVETYPAANGELAIFSDIQLTFNKNVEIAGSWTASIVCNEETIEIPSDLPVVEANKVLINLNFPSYVSCVLTVGAKSVVDSNGNELADAIVLPFFTMDSLAPTVNVELSPVNDFTEASRISDIVITIDDQTAVSINNAIDGGIAIITSEEVFLYTADKLSVADNTVVIANEAAYPHGESVTVMIPDGFFIDSGNNVNAAFSFNFTVTEVTTQPAALTLVATTLFANDVVQIQFDSTIALGSGAITLEGIQVNHVISIPVNTCEASEFTLSCPFTEATEGATYSVVLHAGNVVNIFGNTNVDTVLDQFITIQTMNIPSLVTESCYPKDGDVTVSLNTTFFMKWDQAVVLDAACEIQVNGYETPSSLHTVMLELDSIETQTDFTFTSDLLLPFTQYTLTIPAGCFRNALNIGNEMISYTFTTTRNEAPSLLTFNLEGQQDVLLDASMHFTFNQPLVISENAFILVKARDMPSVERTLDVVEGNAFTIYNQLASLRMSSKTQYTVFIPEGVICNSDNLCMEAMTLTPFTTVTESVNRVILQHTVPTSGATQVSADAPLVLHFTGNVRAASGPEAHYYLYEGETAIEGTATFNGREVSLSFPLQSGKTYTYVYDNNLFTTNKGSPVYYDIGSSFSFTVEDTEGPVHYGFNVMGMESLEILFDEDVVSGTGTLTVYNSANEIVLSSITAGVTTPDNRVVIYLTGQALPDDTYTFQFAAGFVKDIHNNEASAFTETYELDRVTFEVSGVSAPTSAFSPLQIQLSKKISEVKGELYIDREQRCVVSASACTMSEDAQVLYIAPSVCNTLAWEAGEYIITIPAESIVDMKEASLASTKSFTITAPAISPLEVDGEACTPAMNSIVSILSMEGPIKIVFKNTISLAESAQLRNTEGCVIATETSMTVDGATLIIEPAAPECLYGTVQLIAGEHSIYSAAAGSAIAASTAASPVYTFSFKPAGPAPVSAVAVFHNGLQITQNSRIDITFNMEIAASESALANLAFVSFLDSEFNSIEFAKRTHGEIEGSVLRIVVDEAFNPLLSSQIRSVVILPKEDGLYNASTDVASGSVSLSRLFSLPPVGSHIELVDDISSIQPTIEIAFDQAVEKTQEECSVLMVSDDETTYAISIEDLTVVDSKHFTWTPRVTELLKPVTEYTFIADNSCFIVVDTQTAASGISSTLVMTTMMDTIGPVVLGMPSETGSVMEAELTSTEFTVLFNELIELNENATVYFLNEETDAVTQLSVENLSAHENTVTINTYGILLSNVAYSVRFDNLVYDLEGNAMQSMTQSLRIVTPLTGPQEVTNVQYTYLQANVVMISFDAAVDMTLKSATGPCVYFINTQAGYLEHFSDVCVGPYYQGEPIRLSFIVPVEDVVSPIVYILTTANEVGMGESPSFGFILPDEAPIDEAPAKPVLMGIEMIEDKPEERRFTFYIENSVSYTHIASYTFVVSGSSILSFDVAANPLTSMYTIDVPVSEEKLHIAVKATTSHGSTAFAEPLEIEQPAVVSTLPGRVDSDSFVTRQISDTQLSIQWAVPECREKITGYVLYFTDRDPVTVSTNSVELIMGDQTVIEFNIAAVTMVGEGESVHARFTFDPVLTASVSYVNTGATYAVISFLASYGDVNVECALNAGKLIHAVGTVSNDEIKVIIDGLIPSFHYNGLCWAYSTKSSAVSESIPLSFTTAATDIDATLVVEGVTYTSNTKATVSVNIDVPATVYCVFALPNAQLIHSDIVAMGESVSLALDGPKSLAMAVPAERELVVMCTAVNSASKKIGSIARMETTKAYFPDVFEYEINLTNGEKNVSIRPELRLTFSDVPSVNEGSVIFEAIESHEQIVVESGSFVIEDKTVIIRPSVALEHNTKYTVYTSGVYLIYSESSAVFMSSIYYGEYVFTTSSDDVVPALAEENDYTFDPSNSLILQFSKDVVYNKEIQIELVGETLRKTAAVSTLSMFATLEILGLVENASYKLEIPECAFMDIHGNCFAATVLDVETTVDAVAPIVTALDLMDKVNVPNDVPLHFSFSEVVRLNNVNSIVILANNNVIPLAKHNVIVNEKEVTIQLDRGYSMGYAMHTINVQVYIEEDAFRDIAGHPNELFSAHFTAVGQRCGSSYLSTFMEDACKCHSEQGKCWCSCGIVNLFEL